jgi:hypothetical protein
VTHLELLRRAALSALARHQSRLVFEALRNPIDAAERRAEVLGRLGHTVAAHLAPGTRIWVSAPQHGAYPWRRYTVERVEFARRHRSHSKMGRRRGRGGRRWTARGASPYAWPVMIRVSGPARHWRARTAGNLWRRPHMTAEDFLKLLLDGRIREGSLPPLLP